MSIFGKIMEKLGLSHYTPPATPPVIPKSGSGGGGSTMSTPGTSPAAAVTPAVKPMAQVDVVAKLESLAKAQTQKLNWRTSIVDLLKLLGLDSSLSARKELATELHCPAAKMDDSAEMNMWLHAEVLKKLASNGGNIPADLLD